MGGMDLLTARATTKLPDQIRVANTANPIPRLIFFVGEWLMPLMMGKVKIESAFDPFHRRIEITVLQLRKFFFDQFL